jgi:hypothetical protein
VVCRVSSAGIVNFLWSANEKTAYYRCFVAILPSRYAKAYSFK